MHYDQGDPAELREAFWKALADSPFVMLARADDPAGAAPMTAQLDETADHAIWFFTRRDSHLVPGGAALMTFSARGHDLFARIEGELQAETDPARLDRQWNRFVAAWFPGGKEDPDLRLLRMELGPAAIWRGELGALATVKMALGMDVSGSIRGGYAETAL